jgi:hypothetical protein
MGPEVIALIHEIAKIVPLDLPVRYRTSQPDFMVAQGQHFPISMARPAFDEYLLTNLERIGSENEDPLAFALSIRVSFLLMRHKSIPF